MLKNFPTGSVRGQRFWLGFDMRILNCLLDNRFGGPQRRTSCVAEALREKNVETVFLFNEKSKGNIPFDSFRCYLLRHMQVLTRESTARELFLFCVCFFPNVIKIWRIIKSEKIDIVYTNGIVNLLPALAGKIAGVKVIWFLNDTVTPALIRRAFLPFLSLLSDRIALQAKKVGQHYFGSTGRLWQKTLILHAPVDTRKFNRSAVDRQKLPALKEEFNIKPGDFVVGSIGNINRFKGYEYLVEAARLVKRKHKNTKFIILGQKLEDKSDYYDAIGNLIVSSDLENDVLLAGFRDDVPEVLCIFDAFVLSSISEACPMAILEAMAMRVPIVATRVGAVEEQIVDGQTGIIVEPFRGDHIATGVMRIINMPGQDLETMVSKGFARAQKMFRLDIIAKEHYEVYCHLAGRSNKCANPDNPLSIKEATEFSNGNDLK